MKQQPSLGTLDLPFQSPQFLESWSDFKNWRKEIKKPLTATAEKRMLKKISRWKEEDVLASIDTSIAKHWIDLYEVKPAVNGHAVQTGTVSVEKAPCPDWREKLSAITGKNYPDWMDWTDVNWDERKKLAK